MKPKLLHIITGLSDGGAEAVMTRLAISSTKYKHSVISLQGKGKYGKTLEEQGVSVHTLDIGRDFKTYLNIFKLPRLIKLEAPDVIQTWMHHADLIGGVTAKLVGVNRIFWGVRRSSLDGKSIKLSTRVVAHLCAFLSKWIPDLIICCGNQAMQSHAAIGYQRCKLRVIFNGYDLSRFYPDQTMRGEARQSFGLEPHDFVIGNVARFDPVKDHRTLIEALSILDNAGVVFKCLLVGRAIDKENQHLKQLICRSNLDDQIKLLGPRNDIPTVMNAIDIHVLSSLSEGFPNVVAEAMACGTISVSTNVGDAREIVDLVEESICDTQDAVALANLIIGVYEQWEKNDSAWKQRKRLCARKIREQFSLTGMVSQYEGLWV